MRLGALLERLDGALLQGPATTEAAGITHDSRRVGPGMLFAALPGQRAHGLDFLGQAVAAGAAGVLSDRPRPEGLKLPWILTDQPRRHMAVAAWALAGDPQEELLLAAVTGTNGKTTTAHLLAGMLGDAGLATGLFGTLGYRLPGEEVAAPRTTPEATDLAPLLRRLVDGGGRAAVLEVSSHALALQRPAGLAFRVAVWTNLSRDHLDFHHDMEDYFQVKRRLFTEHLAVDGRRVLPVDEPWGRRLLEDVRPGDVTWGLAEGDVHARSVRANLGGTELVLCLPSGEVPLELHLLGTHNLRNALAAAAAACALGLGADTIATTLAAARPLPGRLEPVAAELPFPVFVDYAHTPDGLGAVLASLREVTDRRLVVVFGAGGDRDRGKRGPMGRAVGERADVAIVTSDNPRSEDPAEIAAAVAAGVRAAGAEPLVVLDRREAIARALQLADADTVVVVAGKGHEAEQLVGDRVLPFSDRDVVRELAAGGRR